MIFFLMVVVAAGYCGLVRLARRGRAPSSRAGRQMRTVSPPAVTDLREQTWTALDDHQLTRLLKGGSG